MFAAVTHDVTCGITVQPAGREVLAALSGLEPQFNSLHFTRYSRLSIIRGNGGENWRG
jgi:hypothetical protein